MREYKYLYRQMLEEETIRKACSATWDGLHAQIRTDVIYRE